MAREIRFNAPPLLLREAIDDSQNQIVLVGGSEFYRPFTDGDFFKLTIINGEDSEVVTVNKYEGGTFFVTRGDTPLAFPAGSVVENVDPVESSGPKVYRALLTQSGTDAPVATVLENTLGGDVVWTRQGAGIYYGEVSGLPFVEGKTFIPNNVYSSPTDGGTSVSKYVSGGKVYVETGNDDYLSANGVPFMLEILVYP